MFSLRSLAALTFGASLTLLSPLAGAESPSQLRGEYGIQNIKLVKLQIQDYVASGQYAKEVKLVSDQAKTYLDGRLGMPVEGKGAVCFDIDETCLSNYSHIQSLDFGYQEGSWDAWVNQAVAPALEGTLDLYKYARAKGLHTILITGRSEAQRAVTERNMRLAGFDGWSELVMRGADSARHADTFKSAERKRLTQQGYRILVNIGDQDSDLNGGYAESSFKLPNPMYFVP